MTRVVTRSAVIETFLADLERTKESGIVAAHFPNGLPGWSGGDSDVRTEECGVCFEERPLAEMAICEHCERAYCRECIERHATWTKGERWG